MKEKRTMQKLLWSFVVLSLAMLLAWCATSPVNEEVVDDIVHDAENTVAETTEIAEANKTLNIVTTIPPLYAHVASLIDENDTVTNLIAPGTSVHTRQPRPSDVLAMQEADMIVINGLEIEHFLEEYFEQLETEWVLIVDTSVWVTTRELAHDDHEDEEHHDDEWDEDDHHHGSEDPHIRLDPVLALKQVDNIVAALVVVDPTQQAVYETNATTYRDQLSQLDQTIRTQLDDATRASLWSFLLFHDAYGYFLHRYELEQSSKGVVHGFHGDAPSQQKIAELIETIQSENVQTIFVEPQFSSSVVDRLSEETWVTIREIDPLGKELSSDGYIRMMEALMNAFSG